MTASKSSIRIDRLSLWRNTLQLFHQYNRPPFVGPFKKLGFEYRIEPLVLSSHGEERKPDVVASAGSGWFCLDLTAHESSKKDKLALYKQIDSRYLAQYGLQQHTSTPDVISSRMTFVDDGPVCQLLVAGKLDVLKGDNLTNALLRDALAAAHESDLSHLPSLPFTLLPEMTAQEIRGGLVDIVLQLFAPSSLGLRAVEMVDKGLERLADLVTPKDKSVLVTKVDTQMKALVTSLEGYLEIRDGIFRQSAKWKDHPKTKEYIINKLRMWISQPTSLTDFSAPPPAESPSLSPADS